MEKALGYLFNINVPNGDPIYVYASVGIGNIKLPTAANVWNGQACNYFGECTTANVSLRTTNMLGFSVDMPNPFERVTCMGDVACKIENRSEVDAYSHMAVQLMDKKNNIEYVAAILEQGALYAMSQGLTPTAFNSASWYTRSVVTDSEIKQLISLGLPDPRGNSRYILNQIPYALHSLGDISSSWKPD